MSKRQWRPVTAAEYERLYSATLAEVDRLREAITARFAGQGGTATTPRLAADLQALHAALADLRAGPGFGG